MDKTPLQLKSAENNGQHIVRRMLSQLFIIIAIVLVLFAVKKHYIPVLIEKNVEVFSQPKEINPLDAMQMSPEELDAALNPSPVIEKRLETQQLPEQAVIFEVTIGGVEYLADGTIKRTYSEGDEVPEACPT